MRERDDGGRRENILMIQVCGPSTLFAPYPQCIKLLHLFPLASHCVLIICVYYFHHNLVCELRFVPSGIIG